MAGMVDDHTLPVAALTVQAPTHLVPAALSGPYPLLALLRASALLRPTLDDATGAVRLALSLQLEQAAGGAPLVDAAVLLAREGQGRQQAAQISDRHGRVSFGWGAATLAAAVAPTLQLTVYLVDDGHVRGIAAAPLRLLPPCTDATRAIARHRFTFALPI